MNRTKSQDIFEKLKASLFLSLLVGVTAGVAWLVYFVMSESYSGWELQRFGLYFLKHTVNTSVLWALAIGAAFAVLWSLSDSFEGLAWSAGATLAVMMPVVYVANKQFLPGIRETESLVGNALLSLAALAATAFLYLRVTRNLRILRRLYSHLGLAVVFVIIAVTNALYSITPAYSRMEASPTKVNERFLSMLDVSSDGLARMDPSNSVSVHEDAARRVLDHFAQRTEAVRQDVRDRIKKYYPDPSIILSRSDAILRREFTLWDVTRRLDEDIDWYKNPTPDEVWLFALDEFEWMWNLVAAYVLTGDETYATDYAEIMSGWFEQISLARWKDESDPVWRLIGVGLRLSGSWIDAFYVFLPSPSVSAEIKFQVLAAIHDQAQFLSHFRSPRRNHLIQESFGLLKAGVMFPEFKMAGQWLDTASRRLERAALQDVYPDGGYTEASTFYHRYVVRLKEEILQFAEAHNVTLPVAFTDRLERMYEFLLYTSRPDRRMPQVNDGFHAKVLSPLFQEPARRHGRADFEFFATGGESGAEPPETSKAFPYTGLYVMRSDWTDKAAYLLFDGGLFGSAHGHEDMLSFELFAKGSPFIVEAGTYTYVYDKWHRYFERSFAHNTIVVDGKSQLRQPWKDKWTTDPHTPLPNKWMSTDAYDYVEAAYKDGYGNSKEKIDRSVKHTRRILFVKPDYWVLWDVVTGEGQHELTQLFHFVPMPLELSADTKAVITRNVDGPNLLLYPLYSNDSKVEQIIGAEDPIQGWISPKYGEKEPAPVVIYSKEARLPTVFVDVLMPLDPDQQVDSIEITELPVSLAGETMPPETAIALRIKTPDWTDYIMLSPDTKGLKSFATFESGDEGLLVRVDQRGNVIKRLDLPLRSP